MSDSIVELSDHVASDDVRTIFHWSLPDLISEKKARAVEKFGSHNMAPTRNTESSRSLDAEQSFARTEERIRAEIASYDEYIDEIEDDIITLQNHRDTMANERAKLLTKLKQAQRQGVESATGGEVQKMGYGNGNSLKECRKGQLAQQGQQGLVTAQCSFCGPIANTLCRSIMDKREFKMIQEGDNKVMVLSDSD